MVNGEMEGESENQAPEMPFHISLVTVHASSLRLLPIASQSDISFLMRRLDLAGLTA